MSHNLTRHKNHTREPKSAYDRMWIVEKCLCVDVWTELREGIYIEANVEDYFIHRFVYTDGQRRRKRALGGRMRAVEHLHGVPLGRVHRHGNALAVEEFESPLAPMRRCTRQRSLRQTCQKRRLNKRHQSGA